MAKGTVKWFDDYKGFGFISPEEGEKDIFAHFSNIEGEEGTRKTLIEAQTVEFDCENSEKGLIATNIKVLD
jgi:CspA family cold shock protein